MAVQQHQILPLDQRPPLLRLSHVDKVFSGDVVALRDMNLQVNQGDFISLLGPSGCGKSTALRIISDLMYPTRGSVDWEGEHGRGDLGVVFPGTYPDALGHRRAERLAALPSRRQELCRSEG
jgi:NitT/TauT family transport system ATP-binding protein